MFCLATLTSSVPFSSLDYKMHRRNGNQLTSSATYSSLEYKMHRRNENSAVGYQLLDAFSGWQDQNHRKILQTVTMSSF
jgi:hypothetical protein